MKTILRIISDIALIIGIISFIIFIIDLVNGNDFYFGLPAIIIFGICFLTFVFRKNKKDAFVDIWNVLEIIFDFFKNKISIK